MNFNDKKGALKAAYGALIGFFTGVFLKTNYWASLCLYFYKKIMGFLVLINTNYLSSNKTDSIYLKD